MVRVSIIDGIETNKVSPYDHPAVLAKRAEVRAEINAHKVKPVIYEHRNSPADIKLEKKKYKKVSQIDKDNFLNEILTKFIKNMPNWNFTVRQC